VSQERLLQHGESLHLGVFGEERRDLDDAGEARGILGVRLTDAATVADGPGDGAAGWPNPRCRWGNAVAALPDLAVKGRREFEEAGVGPSDVSRLFVF
jgi:hypothetical protein